MSLIAATFEDLKARFHFSFAINFAVSRAEYFTLTHHTAAGLV